MNNLLKIIGKRKVYKNILLAFAVFYFLTTAIRPTQVLADGNPFVPTTDVLNTGLTAQVGAEELNTASANIANFTDITGAYYDASLKRIVFIGTTNGSGPKFNQDDMAVAVKSVFYNGILPSISIDDDPNNPTGPTALVTYNGGIQNTNFANTLFNADYKLKQYAIGYDPNQVKITSTIPTYKSVVDRYTTLQQTPVAGNKSKFTLFPQAVTLKTATTSSAFTFTNLTMQAQSQAINQNNDTLWNQAAGDFSNDITANYDQYAGETTYFAQAKQLSKIVAILKWIGDYQIPTDSLIAKNYTAQTVSTPSTVQKVSTPTGYSAQGAINYNTPNTYLPDDGTAASLKSSAQAGSNSNEDVTWTFTSGGQQYTAVAVAVGAFKSLGSYSTSVTDFSIPVAGDLALTMKRSYSSFSSGQNGIGQGWDMIPARIYPNAEPEALDIINCNNIYYLSKVAIDTPKGHETFTYNCPGGYVPDDPSYHSKLVQNADGSATVTSTDQTKYQFTYVNNALQITAIQDKNNNAIHYAYDGNGKLTSISDTHNHQLTLSYNAQNLVSSVTDWINRKVQYTYDTNGRLTGVIDPNNNTTNYTYDTTGRLATVTDRTGQVVLTNTYGGDARIATSKNSANLLTTYTYDNVNKVITQTDSNGRTTKTTYDTKARILQQTDPAGKNIIYTYGNETAPLTQKDRNGNNQTFTYDSNGNLTQASFQDNATAAYTYDANNRITKILDNRYSPTKETDLSYDAQGNLTQKTEASLITKYTYDSTGEMITTTDPLNHVTTWTRDSLGDKLTQTDALNNTTNFLYDSIGRLTKVTDPNNNILSYAYDPNGNLLTKTNAVGTTTNTYDKEDRLTKVTLPDNSVIQYAYNPTSTLTSVIDALNNTTTYGYDTYQNLTSQQNALNNTTTNTFDNLNRQTQQTTPLGKVSKWTYDNNGNILSRIDANNKTTNYQYDSLNRLTKITYPDTTTVTYTYDSRNNLTKAVDSIGTANYTYDTFDRLTQSSNEYTQTIKYQYDNANNLTQLTYPDNKLVKYTFDTANRMLTVTDWNNKITSYTYNKNNTLATRTYPGGLTTYYSYDAANRLTTIDHQKNSASQIKYAYTRDLLGNIKIATESGSAISGQTDTFTYDAQGKLLTGNYGYPRATYTYTYDKAGNMLSKNDSITQTNYIYDADNRLTNVGSNAYTYDNNGNLTQKQTGPNSYKTLQYDFEDRLANFGNTDTYKYDGLGNRLSHTDSMGNQTRYVTDIVSSLPNILVETDNTNTIGKWYVYGVGLISDGESTDLRRYYYVEDGMGNMRAGWQTLGSISGFANYDPYGNETWGSGQIPTMMFNKQYQDSTGLYYLRARYYDPSIGRFITKDPLPGHREVPLSQNPYQYAYNNPINFSDPSGQSIDPKAEVNFVYAAFQNGKVVYVGITNDFERRSAEWLKLGMVINRITGLSNLTRFQARAVEQLLIERFGGPIRSGGTQLLNKINSINPKNINYPEAKQMGEELFKDVEGMFASEGL